MPFSALRQGSLTPLAFYNSFFGNSADLFNTTGGSNVFLGVAAGSNNTTSNHNTITACLDFISILVVGCSGYQVTSEPIPAPG
jgi:hypothetical protein